MAQENIEPENDETAVTLCGRFIMSNGYNLKWTTSEQRVLCGGKGVPSWQNIPLSQAEATLRNYLQSRGYHNPTFEKKDDRLYINPGSPTLISKLRSVPEIPNLPLDRYWLPKGKPLTPKELDGIEKWISFRMGRLAYPCAKIATKGDLKTGEVLIHIDPGQKWTIDEIKSDPIPYVRGGVLDRYRAFDIGDPYDPVLLEISAARQINSQTVVNTQYSPDCNRPEPGLIEQRTLPGQPRLVTFGIGFDSENYFIMRGSWRNSRLSETASLLDISANLSFREQTALTSFNWYYLPFPTRHYLRTYVRAQRSDEKSYENRSLKASAAPAWQRDFWGNSIDLYLGPSLLFESTIRGEAPKATRLLTLDLGLNTQSHEYEYYIASPRTGYQMNLFGSFSNKSAASDISVAHYKFDFTMLWNIFDMDPEIWILGLRGSVTTTQPGKDTDPAAVPLSLRQFLGGSDDMRGFARKALPADGEGSLTKAYLGTELRLNNILPYKLQPLIFADFGWLGSNPFDFEPQLLWSPGVGLRWESPIGTVRSSVAYGFTSGQPSDPAESEVDNDALAKAQFYISLGEQF